MRFNTLITTEQLAERLGQPDWLVFDCRFDLTRPDWGFQEYLKSHIPGAGYAHLDKDLAGPTSPRSGRHPLPALEAFVETLQSWGVQPNSQVVVYDTVGGAYAVRLWWMLRWVGLDNCALLDGGFPKWVAEDRPTAAGVESHQTVQWRQRPKPRPWMAVSMEEVEQIRTDPDYRLIDARSPERYRGEIEPIDPVAGRIPGALNRFHADNLQPDGQMKSREQLYSDYALLLNDVAPENTIFYCGSGVTSAHDLLAMEIAGLPGARLYVGSWSEWCRQKRE